MRAADVDGGADPAREFRDPGMHFAFEKPEIDLRLAPEIEFHPETPERAALNGARRGAGGDNFVLHTLLDAP